jgi:hypothetical protein
MHQTVMMWGYDSLSDRERRRAPWNRIQGGDGTLGRYGRWKRSGRKR